MKRIQTIISVGALTAASLLCPIIAQAQNATAEETSQGTLGKRYAAAEFAVGDPQGSSNNIYGTGISVNVPVTSFLDISGGYGYSWYKANYNMQYYTYKTDIHSIGADFVFYKKIAGGLKPFLSAGLGYSWASLTVDANSPYMGYYSAKARDNFGVWNASVGIEIPFRWVSLTPVITYADDFRDSYKSYQTWNYGVEASSWITPKVGVYASVAYNEPKHNPGNAHMWNYGAGLRIKF